MKKIGVLVVLSLLLLSACGTASDSPSQPEDTASTPGGVSAVESGAGDVEESSAGDTEEMSGAGKETEGPYGLYEIPGDWFKVEEFSSNTEVFYLKEGTLLDTPTSNISVLEGTNNYAEGDFMSFAQAIDQQLRVQAAAEQFSYTGGGSYTEKGYPLITMNIDGGDVTTTHYYIVGDYRYVMVHATDFHDPAIPDLDEAALLIVNSFEWNE